VIWSLASREDGRSKGTVSAATIGASITAFIIGLIIIVVIGRYANKPEK
jgi:hypothetical protein